MVIHLGIARGRPVGTVGTVLGGFRSPGGVGSGDSQVDEDFRAESPASAEELAGAEEFAGAEDIADIVALTSVWIKI